MYEQKATLERDKKSDEEKHAMDMSSYKQQKVSHSSLGSVTRQHQQNS